MKYKLLKDIPGHKAGQIFIEDSIVERTSGIDCGKILINRVYAEYYTDFFEPIPERETIYPDNLMKGWIIDRHGGAIQSLNVMNSETVKTHYICGTRFPTKEKASAFIALKKDVARFSMTGGEVYFNEFYINNEDGPYREEVDIGKGIFDKINIDFILPLDATEEEKKTREKLLKDYYGF